MIGKTIRGGGSLDKIIEKLGRASLPIKWKMYLVIYRQPKQSGSVCRSIDKVVEIL